MKKFINSFRQNSLILSLPVLMFSLLMLQSCSKDEVSPLTSSQYITLNNTMTKLWTDHMQWTYSTVDAFFHDENGVGPQLERLLQNQKDIGNAIVPYYGQAAGDQLADLLTEHIQGAVPVLTAAKSGDDAALQTALDAWYANADAIGTFLNNANPEWAKMDMRHMMKEHIDQTTSYSVDLLKGDYASAIKTFDMAQNHMIMMAEELARGIATQFPDKFK